MQKGYFGLRIFHDESPQRNAGSDAERPGQAFPRGAWEREIFAVPDGVCNPAGFRDGNVTDGVANPVQHRFFYFFSLTE
jgi:hypothetical protein